MESIKRKPFQGVTNIIRFNWHYYMVALAILVILFVSEPFLPNSLDTFANCIIVLTIISIALSLGASWYVYDYSNLYSLEWLSEFNYRF